MATLKTNYKDDILDTSANTQRKYRIVNNADGTISLEDVTVYTQNGDSFGAADINKTNQAVLDLNSSLNNTNSYSSNELIIGKWIDGKPIYRKVVTFSEELIVPYDNWVKTGINAENMIVLSAKIISMTGIIADGTFDTPLCYSLDGELVLQTSRNGYGITAKYLIIEYIKTTD